MQIRVVGGHPALSFIAEYTIQGEAWFEYSVLVLGKNLKAIFYVGVPATSDIVDFCKRFDVIVNSLRIP